MSSLQEFGILFIQTLQILSPALDAPMKLFTFLGTVEFYLLLIPFLYWNVNPQLGLRVFMVLISADFFGSAFKHLLHQPRPYWVGKVEALAEEASYGIPSNHASDSLAVWGTLAFRLKRSWLWITAAILVLLIGISRIYLGVHFPHDVIGGWLLGAIILYLFLKGEQWFIRRVKPPSRKFQVGMGLLVSIGILVIGMVVISLIGSTPDPEAWIGYSSQARTPAHYFTLAGALFGAVAGYVLMQQYAPFQARGTWVQKTIRYLLGIVGVVIAWRGLDVLFGMMAADDTMAGYMLRYLRYATTAFWAIFGAPWFFLKLNLITAGRSDLSHPPNLLLSEVREKGEPGSEV